MLRIAHTNTHCTVDQIGALRQHVIVQLADGNDLVVLPPGCTIEMTHAPTAYADVTSATQAIVAAAVSHYEATMKALGRQVEASIEPDRSNIRLKRRCWPERFWLSYKGRA